MEKTKFLMLLSLSKTNLAVGKKVLDTVKAKIDPAAAPLWIDSQGVGLFMESDLPAWQIWQHMKLEMPLDDWTAVKELLVLQIGPGWYARDNQTKAAAWMHARYPRETY
ncbi:hypothetical protein [Polaromonas sp.]|uniref:hypothetical protein n=1 Tax=Polaromonas sp. TaxID=1869339 RepID=UPI00374FE1FE